MVAFPGMLVAAAEKAGIKVPPDPDEYEEMKEEFPHWFVYCMMQLGRPMPEWGCHWDNAHIIASIPEDKIRTVNGSDILAMGFI